MKYLAAWLAAMFLVSSVAFAQEEPPKKETPTVEVVFVLDTTGSMGGLIKGAKEKIWAIVNNITSGKPTPDIKVGLVGYRDRSDVYVTMVHDLSDDLDAIFKKLMAFQAGGGGDTPESVNQALNEAVTKISWSTDKKTLRTIFLVGDCPPHMDYPDDVKYKDSCQAAVKKDIIINTVQCGGHGPTKPIWQEIARLGEGVYIQIAQTGGVVSVATPYDKELAELSRKLDDTVIITGGEKERRSAGRKLEEAAKLADEAGGGAAADRATYKGKSGPAAPGASDLVEKAQEGKLDLDKVKEEELPEPMQKMTKEEREKYVQDKAKQREEIQKKIEELSTKRSQYIKEELSKRSGEKDGFDEKVIEAVRKHASEKGIKYEEEKKEEKKEEKEPKDKVGKFAEPEKEDAAPKGK